MIKRPMCLFCMIFCIMIWCYNQWDFRQEAENPTNVILTKAESEKSKVWIQGQIYDYKKTSYANQIYLKNVIIQNQANQGEIPPIQISKTIVEIEESMNLSIGNVIVAAGIVKKIDAATNPGQFDSQKYYRIFGISWKLKADTITIVNEKKNLYLDSLRKIKEKCRESLQVAAGELYAGFYEAVLLGDKSKLDESIKTGFQMGGVIHILTISGLHLSLIGVGLYNILKKIGFRISISACISAVFLISYSILTGASAATMRALIMFLVSVLAKWLGRSYDLLSALSFAAILLLISNPRYLEYSGFLLSFGAVIGIGAVYPILRECFAMQLRKWQEGILASIAIFLATFPITLFTFFEIPVYSIFLNLILVPFLGFFVTSGMGGMMLGIFSISLAKICIFPGKCLLWAAIQVVGFVQKLPYTTLILGKPSVVRILFYGILLVVGLCIIKCWKKKKGSIFIVIACVILVWPKSHKLTLTMLDIGQGDCNVICSESGTTYMMDCGSSSIKNIGKNRVIPFLKSQGISKIDYLFLTHPDLDHICGAEEIMGIIQNHETSLRLRYLVLPTWQKKNEDFARLEKLAEKIKTKVIYIKKGDVLIDGKLEIEVLHPNGEDYEEDANDGSLVLKVSQSKFSALFTGDITEKVEQELLPELSHCTLLKVAHHGSKYSSSMGFLQKISPDIAVISSGLGNLYGHPHEETIERLKDCGTEVKYTMKQGAVMYEVKG